MASNVHVIGPEFLLEENTRAFLRIEESVRQFSTHSREAIYLIRRPLDLTEDHLVLLWPHGTALLGMFPYGGRIRGGRQGDWENEPSVKPPAEIDSPRRRTLRLREERHAETLTNPHATLSRARHELAELLERHGMEPEATVVGTTVQANGQEKETVLSKNAGSPLFEEARISMLALFTGSVKELHVEPFGDPLFFAMTVEDALARSMVHTPNLLRIADIPGSSYSNATLARISETLERSARVHEAARTSRVAGGPATPATVTTKLRIVWWRRPTLRVIVLVLFVILAGIGFAIYSLHHRANPTPVPPPHTPSHTPSEIIIQTPIEAELFISPFMFRTRDQLDHALTYGEGMRFLPDTEQFVVMDSVTLAKGVYGYFKVDNAWRKGKLLQTLQHTDTIAVVRFLDPLP